MPANLQKIMQEVPRPLEIGARDYQHEHRLDRTPVSRKEMAKRLEPIMGLIANGEITLDEHGAQAIAAYLDEHHRKVGASNARQG